MRESLKLMVNATDEQKRSDAAAQQQGIWMYSMFQLLCVSTTIADPVYLNREQHIKNRKNTQQSSV